MRHCARLGATFGVVAFIFGCFPTASPVRAADGDDGTRVYQTVVKSTAWILVPRDSRKVSLGTGTLVDRKRHLILTNYHVVRDSKDAYALFPIYQKGKLVVEREVYEKL